MYWSKNQKYCPTTAIKDPGARKKSNFKKQNEKLYKKGQMTYGSF